MPDPIDSMPAEVAELWRQGRKIEAIKRLRELKPQDLAAAKGALERHLEGRHDGMRMHAKITAPGVHGLSPGEVPRQNMGTVGIVVLAIAAMVLIWAYVHFA